MTDDSWREIRPIAVGVATRGEELLLSELHDPEADETFYRPPGGGMAFGEASEETVYPSELPDLVTRPGALPGPPD